MKNIESGNVGQNESIDKEYGHNVKAVLEFTRHATPGKTEDGMSADFLTDEGREMARSMPSQRVEEQSLAGYSSLAERARETTDLYLEGASDIANVINKELENGESGTFKIKQKSELSPVADFGKIAPAGKEWAQEQIEAGANFDVFTGMIQYYLDNPDKCQELGIANSRETAAKLAMRIDREIRMTERFLPDTDVRLVNSTHGPNLECFVKEVLGVDSLEEIGGAFGEGENISFHVHLDDEGERTVRVSFKNVDRDLSEDELDLINILAGEYRSSQKQEQSD